MAAYFNIANSTALGMLPADVRCRDDLDYLSSKAEAEIIQLYTREAADTRGTALESGVVTGLENLTTTGSDPVVYLRYYKADADALTTTAELAFKTAMQRAIADLIILRASQEDTDMLVKSESRGRRSVTYWKGANPLSGIPHAIRKWLKAYDKRAVSYSI